MEFDNIFTDRANPKKILIEELKKSSEIFSQTSELLGHDTSQKVIEDIDNLIKSIQEMSLEELEDFLHNKSTKKEISKFINKDVMENLSKLKYTPFSYLNSIKIKNYFSIKNIEITNLKDKKEIYFVGGNGEGKTILLQAIVLALKKEYSGHIIEYIRDIEDELELAVKDENSNEYSSNYNIKNVFAYGINRNKTREKSDKYGYSGIFDTSDFKDTTFLRNPLEVLREENNITHEFIKLLNKYILQGNIKIEKSKSDILVKESINGKENTIDFEKLSEGYKSTLIWLCDLLSRLIENDKKIKKLADFKAIVLIDEVELHLHPKWQYGFMNKLRETFPLIQFIVTTHSSTVLLGASIDAVYYRIYKENGEIKISEQQEIKNDFLNDIQTDIFNFDVNEERIYNPTSDNKRRQKRAKEGLLNLIESIEKEEK